jgi:hypothetical protein
MSIPKGTVLSKVSLGKMACPAYGFVLRTPSERHPDRKAVVS